MLDSINGDIHLCDANMIGYRERCCNITVQFAIIGDLEGLLITILFLANPLLESFNTRHG